MTGASTLPRGIHRRLAVQALALAAGFLLAQASAAQHDRPTLSLEALAITEPIQVDGRLDEEVYSREKPFGGMIQVTPRSLWPMTERSDVWATCDVANR